MSTPDLPPAPAPVVVPAKKSNTLVIVLCVIFGLMILALGSCVGTCIYVGKKAKAYAKESEKNPQISALALAATIYPGVEVVSKDIEAGTLVLKNQKTGEIVTLNAKDFSSDKVGVLLDKIAHGKDVSAILKPAANERVTAESDSTASAASSNDSSASTLKTFRPDFPVYSGGGTKTIEATQNGFAGITTSTHVFETADTPDKVADFYAKKLGTDGYAVVSSENGSDDNGAKLSRVFQKGGMGTTLTIDAHIEDGKTHVVVSQVVLKQ